MSEREQRGEPATPIDLVALSKSPRGNGPRWTMESADLDLTLLSWNPGHEVAPHVNTEVDVLLLVMAGTAELTLDGSTFRLSAGQAVVIPKGVERAITCPVERVAYLSVHRRRKVLLPGVKDCSPS